MGIIDKIIHESLIDEASDRKANLFRVEKSNNGELHIHLRNLKIAVINQEEIKEWVEGFREAKKKLGDYFSNDIA